MRRVRRRYLLPAALGAAAVGLATAGLLSSQATPIPGLGDRDGCAAYTGLPPQWRSSPTAGMAPVRLDDGRQLWFDVTEVTTAQFADFVAATGYVTELERGAGAGAVFAAPTSATVELGPHVWWQPRPDASWRQPRGADGPPAAPNEPVTMVTRADAEALPGLKVDFIDLSELRLSFADGRPADSYGDDTAAVLARIAAGDLFLIGTPIYRGSYTGALKNLLDLIPLESLEGKPVGLVATGATAHHYLAIDAALRPVLAWFNAVLLPGSVYLEGRDYQDGVIAERVRDQLEQLGRALTRLVGLPAAAALPRSLAGQLRG